MTINIRRSVLDTKFLTLREWAAVPLDMQPPQVAFTVGEDGTGITWHDTDWIGNSQVQDKISLPNFGLNYRLHRILIGPSNDATVALPRGRWRIWRQLVDLPEIPVDLIDAVLTMY